MILTDKALKDFNLFLSDKYGKFEVTYFQTSASAPKYECFLDEIELPSTLLNALIIEFFDSVGIYINISVSQIKDKNCIFISDIFHVKYRPILGKKFTEINTATTRQEAT